MAKRLHAVVETPEFFSQAAGLFTGYERTALIEYLAANPAAGDVMPGTGGARKLRWSAKGKGKRGGARVITFYSGEDIPIFLLAAFSKNQKVDLSSAERKELKATLSQLVDKYRSGARSHVKNRR
ncbi:MAG: type II toxin-antitoxin system RelE/ParE family toxin [Alphaproteobacteria bacterium]